MPIVDGELVPYNEWFPMDSPSRGQYDNYFMHFNKGAPKPGEPVMGFRVFYRSPARQKSIDKNLQPGRLYSMMMKDLHVSAAAAHGGASYRYITDNPATIDEDDPSTFPDTVDPFVNGTIPFEEYSPNAGDFFFWPTREIAEEYMKATLQAQFGIEDPNNASHEFTYPSDSPRTISFHPREDEEAAYMIRGRYELHRVYGIMQPMEDNVAGWRMTDMMIDPEVLVELRGEEAAEAMHGRRPVHPDAWAYRYS